MGVGDPLGAEATHVLAAGMGGVRTAGDLVLRMQLAKKMRIDQAKAFVAEKLNVSIEELNDVVVMSEVREDMGIGLCHVETSAQEKNRM